VATRVERGTPSSGRPSGTVTFLFSDIEGSTARWERSRDAMSAAVARHDALMRQTLEAHGGYIFKTMGDEFCAAFFTAPDAIAAALEAQRAIAREDFGDVDGMHVRIALHTGHADERGADYFGPAVNRTARLLAIGHGGQVLVSGTAADLLQGEMPAQSSLRDLGAHRLKDLARPEQVYQLISPDLPESFPALRSLDELPNNLPRQLTSFVGRDRVIADVSALIEKCALVTLVGAGGAGKTRCAIQIGAELLDGSADGVWLAELAAISDPALVSSVIAQSLNVQGQPDRPVLETLLAYLKRKHLLLILDNCEHVIEEARRVVTAILHDCPQVRVLATSREGLNIAGEEVYRVPSLAVPRDGERITTEDTSRYEAVQLFIDRALSVDKRFAFTEQNAGDIGEICERLDGIPLAIELAAARVKVLSPKQLAEKLDERFRLLTGGDRSALPRQQTMRALIDWSYDLLSDEERQLFRKLSIFAGGFTFETAAAVCTSDTIDEMAVLDLLASLVDKSLVQAELVVDGTRYRLLESTRDYARAKLTERGELPAVAQAHAIAFLELAERLRAAWRTTPDSAWNLQAEAEMENWRAALEWALTRRGDVSLAQRLVGNMRMMWRRFAASEGRRWVRAAIATTDAMTPDAVIAELDLTEASLDSLLNQYKASYDAADRALQRLVRLGDPDVVEAQLIAGRALVFLGKVTEAQALLHEALESATTLGLQKLKAFILMTLGGAQVETGDLVAAQASYTQALASARSAGAAVLMATITGNLGELKFRSGDAQSAIQLASEGLHDSHNRFVAVSAHLNLSAYLIALDRYDDARPHAREALRLSRDVQSGVAVAFALQHLAAIALFTCAQNTNVQRDVLSRPARIIGYVNAQLAELEAAREYTEQQEYDKMTAALAKAFAGDELASLMPEGASWSEDQAVAEAMLI
jgi:predicted ATPase/class 3 adenylate cyclase